jgi:hypothetical protein
VNPDAIAPQQKRVECEPDAVRSYDRSGRAAAVWDSLFAVMIIHNLSFRSVGEPLSHRRPCRHALPRR